MVRIRPNLKVPEEVVVWPAQWQAQYRPVEKGEMQTIPRPDLIPNEILDEDPRIRVGNPR